MHKLSSFTRWALAAAMASLGTLICFGLLLSFFGVLGGGRGYRLASSLLSAFLALFAGGWITSWLAKTPSLALPILFGLLWGGFSFLYILGFKPLVLPLALAAGLSSGLGGYLVGRWRKGGRDEKIISSDK
jgi:hypothetical protein